MTARAIWGERSVRGDPRRSCAALRLTCVALGLTVATVGAGTTHAEPSPSATAKRDDAGTRHGSPTVQQRIDDLRRRAADYRARGHARAAAAVERKAAELAARLAVRTPEARALDRAAKLAHIQELRDRFGERLREPRVVNELATHGRRAARLARIKSLATLRVDGEEKARLLERIDRAIRKETLRHYRALDTLAVEVSERSPQASTLEAEASRRPEGDSAKRGAKSNP